MGKRFYTSGRSSTDTVFSDAKKPARDPQLVRGVSVAPTTPEQKAAALRYLTRKGFEDVAEVLGLVTS